MASVRRLVSWGAALCVMVCGWNSDAFAAPQGNVVVGSFRGAKAQGMRDLVAALLSDEGYHVVLDRDAPELAAAETNDDFAATARSAQIKAFVLARTYLTQRDWTTKFSVRDGESGRLVASFEVSGRNYEGLRDAFEERGLTFLTRALNKTSLHEPEPPPQLEPEAEAAPEAPPVPEPVPPPEQVPPSGPKPATERSPESPSPIQIAPTAGVRDRTAPSKRAASGSGLDAFELGVGPAFIQRNWSVQEIQAGADVGPISPLHSVSLIGAQVGLRVYPVGLFSRSFMRHVGLEAALDRSLLGGTIVDAEAGSETRATTFQRIAAGLRIRFPFGSAFGAAIWGGVGTDLLTLEGEKSVAALPDLATDFFRVGGELRLPLGSVLTLAGGAAYRGILRIGEKSGQLGAEEWFPNAKAWGVEAYLLGDSRIAEHWLLRLEVDGSRDVYRFHSDPNARSSKSSALNTAPPVAGGATDLHMIARLAIVGTFSGR